MQLGVIFPQTELGGDVGSVRAYATAVQELGYEHISIFDHVVGADPLVHTGWDGPYDLHSPFHEPLTLLAFLAGLVSVELCTSVVILPQRQTVLVAKQAAEIDLLTDGRFRLGVGIGWNAVEYEALGKSFTDRGARFSEQISLMRSLWTAPSVTFDGRYERVTGAGIAPMPVQRPIPVWIGARADAALRRAGRIGDGWFPMMAPGDQLDRAIELVSEAARDAGRDPAALGMEGQVAIVPGDGELVARRVGKWRDAGATHVSVRTTGHGFGSVEDHIAALAAVAAAIGLSA
jgi:probable F420-dependent oxidoreductase